MHPGMWSFWKAARHAAACGAGHHHGHGEHGFEASGDDGELGAGFGVRRPLRFMAYKLGLDEAQVGQLAQLIAELKTERAQIAVDDRRTLGAFADAVGAEAFDADKAKEAAQLRVRGAERLRDAVLRTLQRTHEILRPEQRARLAYLLRTGALTI
jgi:Spy/CpxP family protein refolding chaperone